MGAEIKNTIPSATESEKEKKYSETDPVYIPEDNSTLTNRLIHSQLQ